MIAGKKTVPTRRAIGMSGQRFTYPPNSSSNQWLRWIFSYVAISRRSQDLRGDSEDTESRRPESLGTHEFG